MSILDELSEHQLYDKLLDIRRAQQASPESDHDSLLSYMERIMDMQNLVKRILSRSSLTERTMSLLRTVTHTDFVAASFVLKLSGIIQTVGKAKEMDIVSAMANLSLDDSVTERIAAQTTRREDHSPPRIYGTHPTCLVNREELINASVELRPSRLDICEAREWALDHLYNLYPPRKTKQTLAKQSAASEAYINSWFTHLRRRIGWTKIVKSHFKGNKALAIDAARSVFFEGEEAMQCVGKPIYNALMAMKKRAQDILKPPNVSDMEKRIDDLVGEIRQIPPDLRDEQAIPNPNCPKDASKLSPNESTPQRGVKCRSDVLTEYSIELSSKGELSVCKLLHFNFWPYLLSIFSRTYFVEPLVVEAGDASKGGDSRKRKRSDLEDDQPVTKKRSVWDPLLSSNE